MAEMEIKRVNFFDGQFLKEGEFVAFDAYHLHMRRRWAFVMFDKSGVVQATPTDLTLVAPAPGTPLADKKVLVKAGMAIGKRTDLAEAKEVVLRLDTEVSLLDPQWGLAAGDTAVFTIHYDENPVANPPSEGDVPGDTRIEERAFIKVHKNSLSSSSAPNGEPYVRLGDVAFDNLAPVNPALRSTAYLNGGLVAPVAPAPQITLTPNSGVAGGAAVTITVNATGLNLSAVSNANVTVSPNAAPALAWSVANQTSGSLTLTLTIPAGAPTGARTITVTAGGLSASAAFAVQPGLQLTSFTPVDQPNNVVNLVLNGTGFAAGQQALVQFAGASSGVVIPGANITATTIAIPMTSIPDTASSGVATVTTGGSSATIDLLLPVKITSVSPLTPAQGAKLTITGFRLKDEALAPIHVANATHVIMVRAGGTLMDKSAFGGAGESISPTQIEANLTSNVTPGGGQLRIKTGGGTVLFGATITVT